MPTPVDPALEAMLPASLRGIPLQRASVPASLFTPAGDMCFLLCPDEPGRLAAAAGLRVEDLTVAFAIPTQTSDLAVGSHRDPLPRAWQRPASSTSECVPAAIPVSLRRPVPSTPPSCDVGSRPVTWVTWPPFYRPAQGEYLMASGDVLFIIAGLAAVGDRDGPGRRRAHGAGAAVGPGRPAGTIADVTRDSHRPIREAWIVEAVRTPIGRYGGALASVRPDDLAATVLRALVDRAGVDPGLVEDVILGCANQAGEDNRDVARMALLLADFPVEVGGLTVNRLCGSGLQAINSAAHAIAVGDGDVFIGGGVESMTRAPYVQLKAESPFDRGPREMADTTLGWRFVNPRLAERHYPYSMGETAENVAERWGVSRERQDAFALESQQRAVAAIEAGRFADQIVPISIPQRKGEPLVIDRDEHPRADTSLEALGRLKPGLQGQTAARSPPATAPASTTARRRSSSSRRSGRASSAFARSRVSCRPRSPGSTRR